MRKILFVITLLLTTAIHAFADGDPKIKVTMDATTSDEKSFEGVTTVEGSAPLEVTCNFETENADDWSMDFEWRFAHEGESLDEPYMTRYETSPTVTFTQAGTDTIALFATFTRDGYEPVVYRSQFYNTHDVEAVFLTVTATESKLVFPNAFSPNEDGTNDYFKPKEYNSIVSFKAYIFNRWGQKIYEWNDVAGDGWNGKFHGHDCKQGTYYVLCIAKGADGRRFEIKKDVNLLRTFDNSDSSETDGGTE